MSKYVKLEDAIEQVKTEFYGGVYQEWLEISIDNLINRIANLPTIEVSEDCVSRKWLEENAKEFGDYYENTVWAVPLSVLTDAPSVIPQVPNEDAISREWLISFIDAGHLRNPNELCYSERGVVELIKHAPSVLPKPKEGEWITVKGSYEIICSNCECEAFSDYGEYIKTDYCPNCGARTKGEKSN